MEGGSTGREGRRQGGRREDGRKGGTGVSGRTEARGKNRNACFGPMMPRGARPIRWGGRGKEAAEGGHTGLELLLTLDPHRRLEPRPGAGTSKAPLPHPTPAPRRSVGRAVSGGRGGLSFSGAATASSGGSFRRRQPGAATPPGGHKTQQRPASVCPRDSSRRARTLPQIQGVDCSGGRTQGAGGARRRSAAVRVRTDSEVNPPARCANRGAGTTGGTPVAMGTRRVDRESGMCHDGRGRPAAAARRLPAGAHDAEPGYGRVGGEAGVPHHPQRDQRPGPPQPRPAVHRHHRLRRHHRQEGRHRRRRRRRAVGEEEVVVADAGCGEVVGGVGVGLVEPHHGRHPQRRQQRRVVRRRVRRLPRHLPPPPSPPPPPPPHPSSSMVADAAVAAGPARARTVDRGEIRNFVHDA